MLAPEFVEISCVLLDGPFNDESEDREPLYAVSLFQEQAEPDDTTYFDLLDRALTHAQELADTLALPLVNLARV